MNVPVIKIIQIDALIPKVGVITDIRQETPDVKTFRCGRHRRVESFLSICRDSVPWSVHRCQ